MSAIISNLKRFGDYEIVDKLRNMLRERAAELIRATTKKVKLFKKPDGSFGYTWNAPPATSQGAPVCPPGIIEGDINGGTIAIIGAWGPMCSALGIDVPVYGKADYEKFISRIIENTGYKF